MLDISGNASYAIGMTAGYALASSSVLTNALTTTALGVTRVAVDIFYHTPLTKELFKNADKFEKTQDLTFKKNVDDLLKKQQLSHFFYKTSLGFSHGLALGSASLWDIGLVYIAGHFAEGIPRLAFKKPLVLNFDENGSLIENS